MRVVARRRGGYTHDVEIEGGHTLVIDEPKEAGGEDLGPTPIRAVAAGLAACAAITCEMYAERKGWDLGAVECEVDVVLGRAQTFEDITLTLRVPTELDADQRDRLLQIAAKCPVHRALSGDTKVVIHHHIESA